MRDSSGGVIGGADVSLHTAQQVIVGTTRTDTEGRFAFNSVSNGSYILIVVARAFAERRLPVSVRESAAASIEVVLDPNPIAEEVTVTAIPGVAESIESASQQVNIISRQEIEERAKTVVAQVANEEPGVQLQRTSPSVSGIFVRGLTGNKVNVFIDGVRYSTSAQRGGINTFLNLIDPSSLQGVEILRGPNSAQYGSDAIGGSIQFISSIPSFSASGKNGRGRLSTFFNSADAGFGSSLSTSFAAENFGLVASLAGHRVNTLRTGGGIDSHNAVTRFFGVSSDAVIDNRMPDTAFTQYGGLIKANWAPSASSQFIVNYHRAQQDGGKRYDQLLGGDGNLIADLRNLMLDFFYAKYDRLGAGWLDNLTLTYSFNSQREERVSQGGNGNPRATVAHEYERTNVNGLQALANKQIGSSQNLLVGGEYYRERIDSPSYGLDPVTGVATPRRPRVPDNARYDRGGVYGQYLLEAVPNKVRLVGNARYSAAAYRARAEDSPLVNNRRLWPSDSLKVSDVTFRAGATFIPVSGVSLSVNVSRGFRAPHLTDLDTVGVTGSGFEVTASEVAGLGATVGSTADGGAVSTGLQVEQVRSETSLSYEATARFYSGRIDTDFAFFVNNIHNGINKQALILPQGAVGIQLGDQIVTTQSPGGAVFVAASTNPVLVRANIDDARIYGIEHSFKLKLTPQWAVGTVLTYLRARDRKTGLPPNIEGGTPAPEAFLKLRYNTSGSRFWVESYVHAADRQERLSTLDLSDRRTGAARSRASIAAFFNNGARARGFVAPGPDGASGTADDRLIFTGETLTQVQDRVLGPGVDSVPLFPAVPGYFTLNLRAGFKISERHDLLLDFENITDRNYRGVSWGVDAPGRGIFVRYNTRF